MSRVWFREELETVASFWRVLRNDGVTVGLTTHDQDLWFDGIRHRAAPGMVPSAIRRSADLEPDSADVMGSLSHDSISASDLSEGRFDGARVKIGLVDWETGEKVVLYSGSLGSVSQQEDSFSAELVSRKAELRIDPVPRTAPTCRAHFCAPGCNLNAAHFTHEAILIALNAPENAVQLESPVSEEALVGGTLRWFDGPHAGMEMPITGPAQGGGLILAVPIDGTMPSGLRAIVREGCDRRLETCASRFANAANFQGEPHLPGNDLISRYPLPPS